jgi:hypothetical protein
MNDSLRTNSRTKKKVIILFAGTRGPIKRTATILTSTSAPHPHPHPLPRPPGPTTVCVPTVPRPPPQLERPKPRDDKPADGEEGANPDASRPRPRRHFRILYSCFIFAGAYFVFAESVFLCSLNPHLFSLNPYFIFAESLFHIRRRVQAPPPPRHVPPHQPPLPHTGVSPHRLQPARGPLLAVPDRGP